MKTVIEKTEFTCDQCDKLVFELTSLSDKTAYTIEFVCGSCGKWHKYSVASSETPTHWNL